MELARAFAVWYGADTGFPRLLLRLIADGYNFEGILIDIDAMLVSFHQRISKVYSIITNYHLLAVLRRFYTAIYSKIISLQIGLHYVQ